MFKYPFEFKLKVVTYVIKGMHSYKQASDKYKIHQEQIRCWCNRYKASGEAGIKPHKPVIYDGAFKVDVVEYMYANHLSFEKTAIHFKLPSSTNVVLWKQIYDERGREYLLNSRILTVEDRRVKRVKRMNNKGKSKKSSKSTDKSKEELLNEIEELRMENDYLKKLRALVQKRVSQQKKKRR